MNLLSHKYQLSTTSLIKLKESLPYGSISVISRKLKISKSTVSRVLDGKSTNHLVVKQALNIVKKKQQNLQQLSDQIESL